MEFYESNARDQWNSGACVVIKRISDLPNSEMQSLKGKMVSSYPRVRVLVKPHKGNIVYGDPFIRTIYEAVSDFQEL